jgi:hypothetical protein
MANFLAVFRPICMLVILPTTSAFVAAYSEYFRINYYYGQFGGPEQSLMLWYNAASLVSIFVYGVGPFFTTIEKHFRKKRYEGEGHLIPNIKNDLFYSLSSVNRY